MSNVISQNIARMAWQAWGEISPELSFEALNTRTQAAYLDLYNAGKPENEKISIGDLYGQAHYDKFNAFQHAYTTAIWTYSKGYETAELAGLYKEFSTWDKEIENNGEAGAYLDTNRDLWNNHQGSLYAQEYTEDVVASKIFESIYGSNSDFIWDTSSNGQNDIRRVISENTKRWGIWEEYFRSTRPLGETFKMLMGWPLAMTSQDGNNPLTMHGEQMRILLTR